MDYGMLIEELQELLGMRVTSWKTMPCRDRFRQQVMSEAIAL